MGIEGNRRWIQVARLGAWMLCIAVAATIAGCKSASPPPVEEKLPAAVETADLVAETVELAAEPAAAAIDSLAAAVDSLAAEFEESAGRVD